MAVRLGRRDLLGLIAAAVAAPSALARPARYPAPERELMVSVPGGRVYVRVNGPLGGPRAPVVMIHGGPGGTHAGFLDALELANERAVILYDQLDSGRSDHPLDPANWRVERFVDELEAIRAALGVPRWHVAGASWGGTVALEYGARRPTALAGLALLSPLVSTRSWIADANALRGKLPGEVQATLTRCEASTPPPKAQCDAATEQFYAQFLRREPLPEAFKAYRDPRDRGFNERLYLTMWGPTEFAATGTLKAYDGEPLLARLDGRRTLFMVGQYDEARPVTAVAFSERVPGAELAVVPGAGHAVLVDRPDEATALLRAWLARQDRLG
ncbi:proline iminopeptidase-family hydrolase [Phenylobacterium sp.]|jgi:proline iminopeptidase/L-proline amide hydrolase|uniref:proline iminopeptidase-family hydrolase n=1 Tax=Phenylobacterium sp. TaxID=1871053 RepID=UPI002F953F89